MSKKFMTVGELRALLAQYPDGALIAVTGLRDRHYSNIRLQPLTVPGVDDHVGWDYDLCQAAPGQAVIVIEADNPY